MVKLTFPHVAILSVALSIGLANPAQQKIVIDQDEGSGSMELSSIQFEGRVINEFKNLHNKSYKSK